MDIVDKNMQGTHNVYVAELSRDTLKHKKVLKLNPDHDHAKPPLYVGMTGLSPEARFAKHKAGLKSNKWVKDYGLRLRSDLSKGLSGLSFDEAEKKEEMTAKHLRSLGHAVLGGNPQLANRNIKRADWKEFDRKRDAAKFVLPQQARIVKRIQDPNTPGLVLFHGVGSGKTKSSIDAYRALGLPTDVIVPAALQENYRKEMQKWLGKVPKNVNIVSQQRLANSRLNTPLYDTGLQIVDEAQKAKNDQGKLYRKLLSTNPNKRLLLSGTPMLNDPTELARLVNLAAKKQVLPSKAKDFRKKFFSDEEVSPGWLGSLTGVSPGAAYKLQNQHILKPILDKYVDYYKPTSEGYPSVKEEAVRVPMGQHQQNIYDSIMGKASWWARYKVKHNIPPSRGELESMRWFLSGPRQVSNTTSGFTTRQTELESPKVNRAFQYFKSQLAQDPKYKAVVYSNYINNGIKPYQQRLQAAGIPYGEFTGNVDSRTREQAVRDYNAGKLKALLISGAGAEGLDLKNTRLTQLLEPHWNLAKERQIIGRGARFQSHAKLPPEKRNMLVQRYFAQPAPSLADQFLFNSKPTGTDEYIHNLAKNKDAANQAVLNLISKEKASQGWIPWLADS